MPTGGIRNRNSSKRAAADSRLRPRGHWDRRSIHRVFQNVINEVKYNGDHIHIAALYGDRDEFSVSCSDIK